MAELEAAEADGGGLQERCGAVRLADAVHPAQAELVEEFLQQAFQVMEVELRLAVGAAPEERLSLAGEGDGDAAISPGGRARAIPEISRGGRGARAKTSEPMDELLDEERAFAHGLLAEGAEPLGNLAETGDELGFVASFDEGEILL